MTTLLAFFERLRQSPMAQGMIVSSPDVQEEQGASTDPTFCVRLSSPEVDQIIKALRDAQGN